MGLVGTFLIIRTKKGKISTKKSNRLQYTMNDFENKKLGYSFHHSDKFISSFVVTAVFHFPFIR